MKILSILSILAIFLLSCSKEIDFKYNHIEKKLVLNGLICPDSLISVHLSRTNTILSDEILVIENATVTLFCNGKFVEILEYYKHGIYKSRTVFPRPDSVYTITAEAEGYLPISATDTVPRRTSIIFGFHSSGNTYDEYGDPHHDYEITISDPPEKNFYELFFIYQNSPNIFSDDYSLHFQVYPVIADPVLRSDSELDYWVFTYVFTDNFFNGTNYLMKNKFLDAAVEGGFANQFVPTNYEDRYAILRTTSLAYYNYRKSWIRHSNNQQIGNRVKKPLFMTLIGDPTPMYSNVEGGYGIFAAYNQTYYKLEEL
ncbi:MAG: DUF4249 domain-containing protein [Prolixibacteraceae bacterium]|jgi:hypothetical protein|nr:DUF4249 domain-containing protein [Bacteroidales bacterium]MDI9564249.1 DUF4249 domain-containing protein [Bacteroidota bacterium]OQB81373.1 MAG: hypothetical protein BWX87_00638 [Bacteroidetes bacterium ADurb.Bin123]HNZ68672.1 DUF4249 domain-containing protein [Prolixibacteraceae bacterium]NLS99458.1 DUF4249 domain-containing protein [Bacteroidales bacterium]